MDYHYNNKERHGYFHEVCSRHKSGALLKTVDVCQNVIYEDGAMMCAFGMIGVNMMSTLLVIIATNNQQVSEHTTAFGLLNGIHSESLLLERR